MNPECTQTTKVYVEEPDTASKSEKFNSLKVKTVSNGVGNYIVIKTKRWAIDDDTLPELFKELSKILQESNSKS